MFKSFHLSKQGASHIKRNKECQDSSVSYCDGSCAIAIVGDGHGGNDYVRSKTGSDLACSIAKKNILDFIKNVNEDDLVKNYEKQLKALEGSIISEWGEAIHKDYDSKAFTNEEIAILSEHAKKKYLTEKRIDSAYGTTLIAVVVTPKYWFGLHIGDGKCVAVSKSGKFSQPIPWDEKCFLNATTSLCDSDAINNFRHYFSTELPAAVFVGSDGIDDCFKSDEQLNNLYRTVLYSFATTEFDTATNDLGEYLPTLSAKGSGDDVSIASVLNIEIVKELDIIKNYNVNAEKARVENSKRQEAEKLEKERQEIEARRAEAEKKRKAEEEAERKRKEAEEAERRRRAEEVKRRTEEAERKRKEAEEAERKLKEAEEARRKFEEVERQRKIEEEARRQSEEFRKRLLQNQQNNELQRRQAEIQQNCIQIQSEYQKIENARRQMAEEWERLNAVRLQYANVNTTLKNKAKDLNKKEEELNKRETLLNEKNKVYSATGDSPENKVQASDYGDFVNSSNTETAKEESANKTDVSENTDGIVAGAVANVDNSSVQESKAPEYSSHEQVRQHPVSANDELSAAKSNSLEIKVETVKITNDSSNKTESEQTESNTEVSNVTEVKPITNSDKTE